LQAYVIATPGTDLNILFADDMLLYRCIDSQEDVQYLQEDGDTSCHWFKDNHLAFNPSKCRYMHDRDPQVETSQHPHYLIGGYPT